MMNLQVRNMPDDLHERLRRSAKRQRCSMSAFVLRAIERELEWDEWRERIETRPPRETNLDSVSALHEARRERDGELGLA